MSVFKQHNNTVYIKKKTHEQKSDLNASRNVNYASVNYIHISVNNTYTNINYVHTGINNTHTGVNNTHADIYTGITNNHTKNKFYAMWIILLFSYIDCHFYTNLQCISTNKLHLCYIYSCKDCINKLVNSINFLQKSLQQGSFFSSNDLV
jgi:hypothetical protein